jgi:hypothetical protein
MALNIVETLDFVVFSEYCVSSYRIAGRRRPVSYSSSRRSKKGCLKGSTVEDGRVGRDARGAV